MRLYLQRKNGREHGMAIFLMRCSNGCNNDWTKFTRHPDDRAKCFLPTNVSEDTNAAPSVAEQDPGFKQSTSTGTAFGQGPGEISYQTEMRLLRKDGKYRWFLVKCISVEVVEQGRKWFGTCTDINDQKLLEHKLKEAHDAAQKSTESKTRFLSNMSHGKGH